MLRTNRTITVINVPPSTNSIPESVNIYNGPQERKSTLHLPLPKERATKEKRGNETLRRFLTDISHRTSFPSTTIRPHRNACSS